MSKYTTTIRDILDSFLLPEQKRIDMDVIETVKLTQDRFFNFQFPWYSDTGEGLDEFKTNFLLRYYNSYIGFETLGMFKTYLAAHLGMEMPYYKQLWAAIKQGNDPFTNIDVWYSGNEKDDRTQNIKSADSGSSTTNTQSIQSDNPQVTVATNDYASSMDRGESTSTASTSGTSSTTDERINEHLRHEAGFRGISKAEAVKKYASQIFNINRELISSSRKLFLGRW